MNGYDELVSDFVLMKFRDWWSDVDWKRSKMSSAYQHAIRHQLECPDSKASVKLAEWECGCWSEYTREDFFLVKFRVTCGCGSYYDVNTSLDLQGENVIEQLEEYESTRYCEYDEENE